MEGSTYNVVLRLSTQGSLSGGLDVVGVRAAEASKAVDHVRESTSHARDAVIDLGSRAGETLSRMADRAIDVGLELAKWGGAAVAGVATYGVAHLNNELEQTQISIAAIGQAQGYVSTFERGMGLAADQVSKMKQDVKSLPGDLGQLSDIMKTIATPAAQAHASMDQIRQLAGKTMLTSAILGVPQEVASREMAQLLAGRAGSHNILGSRLGLIGEDAKAFNASGPEARLARITTELGKYQGATDRFSQSFVANWTTLKDNVKYGLISESTAPLFERVKQSLAEINDYFDTHKAKIHDVTVLVGQKLVGGWNEVEAVFKRVAPIVGQLADHVLRMSGKDVTEGLKHAAETALAMKVAGAGISAGFSIAGSMGGGGLLAGGLGGEAIAGAAGALATAAAVAAPFVLMAGSALDVLTNKTSIYHDRAVTMAEDLATTATQTLTEVAQATEPARSSLRAFADYLGAEFIEGLDYDLHALKSMGEGIAGFFRSLPRPGQSFDAANAWDKFDRSVDTMGPVKEHDIETVWSRFAGIGAEQKDGAKGPVKVPPVHVNIGQISINVQSNQDPGRIARMVHTEFKRQALYPTMSPHVPDYGRGGG